MIFVNTARRFLRLLFPLFSSKLALETYANLWLWLLAFTQHWGWDINQLHKEPDPRESHQIHTISLRVINVSSEAFNDRCGSYGPRSCHTSLALERWVKDHGKSFDYWPLSDFHRNSNSWSLTNVLFLAFLSFFEIEFFFVKRTRQWCISFGQVLVKSWEVLNKWSHTASCSGVPHMLRLFSASCIRKGQRHEQHSH